jgi:hypothetical protein
MLGFNNDKRADRMQSALTNIEYWVVGTED